MKRILFVAGMFLLLQWQACNDVAMNDSKEKVFRYNESKGITSLDPAYARNQTIIWPVSQIFNGLVQLDDCLNVHPSIAKEWSINSSGTLYTFILRSDVEFHKSSYFDKKRIVNAHDFVYSLNRIIDPEVASPGSWIFEVVDDTIPFSAANDTTLIIKLKKAFPPFLSILTMPYCSVVPYEVVENPDADFAHHPVGSGPFLFKSWSQDEKLILLKNPSFFEKDSLGMRLPYLEAISISFIKDKQSEFLEFLKGNLDFLSGVHPAYKDELLTRSGSLNPKYADKIKIISQAYLNTEYLGILQNPANKDEQVYLDKSLRKAINYGFDREKMMKYLRNNLGYPATGGMIPPGLSGHFEQGYTFNPDKAMELIKASSYRANDEGQRILLTTTSDYLDLCEYIQFELSKIGLDIEITVSTGGSFRNLVANGNLQFFRASWIADYADAENYLALFYSGNHAPQGPNYTRFNSQLFDRYYEKAIQELTPAIRHKYYRMMDSIVIEEAPVVPLYYDMLVRFTPINIEGFMANPMNMLVLKSVRKSGN